MCVSKDPHTNLDMLPHGDRARGRARSWIDPCYHRTRHICDWRMGEGGGGGGGVGEGEEGVGIGRGRERGEASWIDPCYHRTRHTCDWNSVATLLDAWLYRVSAGTGWSGLSIF